MLSLACPEVLRTARAVLSLAELLPLTYAVLPQVQPISSQFFILSSSARNRMRRQPSTSTTTTTDTDTELVAHFPSTKPTTRPSTSKQLLIPQQQQWRPESPPAPFPRPPAGSRPRPSTARMPSRQRPSGTPSLWCAHLTTTDHEICFRRRKTR